MEVVLAVIKTYWLQLVLIAAGIAVGFVAAWNLQGIRLDSLEVEFGTYRLAVERQAVIARAEAIKQKEQWIKEKEDAEQHAAEREEILRTERDTALAAGTRLRDTIATLRVRLADAPGYACIATADALAGLLDQCQQEYRVMGEIADGHASDVQTLMEAWPK